MKNNKVVLPLIILLLLCFLPLSIYGIYNKIVIAKEGGNPEHLHKIGNTLYYYSEENTLIGTYDCKNLNCDDAVATIDDEYLKHYEGEGQPIGMVGSEYIIIQDGDKMMLHSLNKNTIKGISILDLSAIKNYGTRIAGNRLIIKDTTGKYGLFNLDTVSFAFETRYSFMGLAANIENGELKSDRIAVLEDTTWYVIDDTDQKLSQGSVYPIYDYDEKFIYYIDDAVYYIHTYDGSRILAYEDITKIDTVDNHHVIANNDGEVKIYDYMYENTIKEFSEFGETLTYAIENGVVKIYNGSNLYDEYKIGD
ncbi:MAG: hypothetical protein IJO63_03685 [Bacilli bacterium]|nr:hypothetical protein [Bacilli bacterium]